MEPIVHDLDGSVHDMAWLRERYGNVEYLPPKGMPKFDLTHIFVTEGPTNLTFAVKAANGAPAVGQPVAYSYPSLDTPSSALPAVPMGADKSGWMKRACIERCDPDGRHNFEVGDQSWIKNGVGPYVIAVISPSTYSACLTGVGWLGGTNHRGPCYFVFEEVTDVVSPPPPPNPDPEPEPEPTGDLAETNGILRGIAADLHALRVHLGG